MNKQQTEMKEYLSQAFRIDQSFPWKSLSPRQTHTPSLLAKQSLCAVQRGRPFDFAVFIAFSILSLKIERLTPL
ncbi:hypothetical protein [[Clostridium] scindens]|uniref:hypothetical protein n=1 Tax=Clostridium scindens (strain JCM 10418 / VPI 12708) TaxID=29347 RepID=UPI002B30D491|nr:hypothetical protein PBLEJBOC_02597 [[Clostridium] scindens]